MASSAVRVCASAVVVAAALVLWAGHGHGQRPASAQDAPDPTRGECFVDAGGDVVGAGGEPADGGDADRADLLDYCVDFGAEQAVFAVRLADEADPREDPDWSGIHHLIWSVVTSGEQLEGGLVAHDPHAPYAVRFFPDGADGSELGALLEEPGPAGGRRVCDGEASYEEGWLVSTFPVGADSPCFPGETQLAVSLGTSFETTDGSDVLMDQAPDEEGRFRGFIHRTGDIPTACRDRDVPPAGYPDVDAGSVHADAIDCVVWYEIARGTGPASYSPGSPVSRGQMASFLARIVDASDATLPAGEGRFDDAAGSVHGDNIERLAAADIVQGTRDGSYHPGARVRRDQLASFLVRTFEFVADREAAAGVSGFHDVAGNAHEGNIHKTAALRLASGTTRTTYSPGHDVRRDRMASFMSRTLERLVVEGRLTPRETGEPVPDPLADVRHGGQYWGVLWVGDYGDARLDRVREAIHQRWDAVWSDGDVACDRDAAEELDVDPSARRVAVYFDTEDDASQFAAHAPLPSEPTGYAQVTTYCLD